MAPNQRPFDFFDRTHNGIFTWDDVKQIRPLWYNYIRSVRLGEDDIDVILLQEHVIEQIVIRAVLRYVQRSSPEETRKQFTFQTNMSRG